MGRKWKVTEMILQKTFDWKLQRQVICDMNHEWKHEFHFLVIYLPSILAEFASPGLGFDECDDKSKTFSRIVLFMV